MRLKMATAKRRKPDLTSLINIVFLILIFFIVAGALRPFSAKGLKLTQVVRNHADSIAPGQLILHADGRIAYRGRTVELSEIMTITRTDPRVRTNKAFVVVADKRLPATNLLDVTARLREAGVQAVAVMAERTPQ